MLFKGKTKRETVPLTIRRTDTKKEETTCVVHEHVPFPNDKLIKVEALQSELKKNTAPMQQVESIQSL